MHDGHHFNPVGLRLVINQSIRKLLQQLAPVGRAKAAPGIRVENDLFFGGLNALFESAG